jgi:hypothetical protein
VTEQAEGGRVDRWLNSTDNVMPPPPYTGSESQPAGRAASPEERRVSDIRGTAYLPPGPALPRHAHASSQSLPLATGALPVGVRAVAIPAVAPTPGRESVLRRGRDARAPPRVGGRRAAHSPASDTGPDESGSQHTVATSATTISLSDSSVERIANRMHQLRMGGPIPSRTSVPAVDGPMAGTKRRVTFNRGGDAESLASNHSRSSVFPSPSESGRLCKKNHPGCLGPDVTGNHRKVEGRLGKNGKKELVFVRDKVRSGWK